MKGKGRQHEGGMRDEQRTNTGAAGVVDVPIGDGRAVGGGNASPKPEADVAASAADGTTLASPTSPASETDGLRARVVELEDQLLRARAEQQNIRKRAANELSDAVRYGPVPFVKSLLGTMDDFGRALAQGDGADPKSVVAGVRLVYDNLMKALREHGIEPIEAMGRPFDPHQHEAVQQVATTDAAPGTVVAVLQGGFRMAERVLRPAKVVIAAARENERAAGDKGPADGAE